MRKIRVSRVVALVVALIATSVVAVTPAHAANGSDFNPGYIMSDEVFYNSSTMSAAQVQQFLNSKVSRCEAGYTCLKDYTTPTASKSAVANRCSGYSASGSQSAATIIYNVAQSCGINPQVLLVLLQKEQGLVTNTAPSAGRYRSATGYGCPDTAACDSTYYGFFNQVYQAAYQFKVYQTSPTYFNFRAGRNNTIGWHPNASCGSSTVYIENQATAGLYNYTPYRPNAAALSNMYASGDSCSSYGNRNFFAYFTDWFGSASGGANDPIGSLDLVTGGTESARIQGWVLDPDSTGAVDVHIYVDGVGVGGTAANRERPDIGAAYPKWGAGHGFDSTITLAPGQREICVYMINLGPGATKQLGCETVDITSASPIGAVETLASEPGQIRIVGWALDPETANSLDVHVYVDGVGRSIKADALRGDIAKHYPALGGNHGFNTAIAAETGMHSVCVYAINQGKGTNTLLKCENLQVYAGSPIGSVDAVSSVPGGITVSGWAFDPDFAAASDVHIYVDGTGYATPANLTRTDIGRSFPAYGADHGFTRTYSASEGPHTVCVYAINAGRGATVLLDCRVVTVKSGSPTGSLDAATVMGGEVEVSGWALDPDTADPISVHVYIDNTSVAIPADKARSDIGRLFPAYGSGHGYTQRFPVTPGAHTICTYAMNVKAGNHVQLGCLKINV